MQTTRERIIDLLRGGRLASIDDITHALELAPATVRRHLDVLQRDGLVAMRSERRPLGRPHFVFSLTDAGRDSLPEHQLRLTLQVIKELAALDRADTRGCDGRKVAARVFDRLAGRTVSECRARVQEGSAADRVSSAVDALNACGFSFEVEACEDGYCVRGPGCPCVRLLSNSPQVCEHNRLLLAGLLGPGVEVVGDGSRPTEYFVRTLQESLERRG